MKIPPSQPHPGTPKALSDEIKNFRFSDLKTIDKSPLPTQTNPHNESMRSTPVVPKSILKTNDSTTNRNNEISRKVTFPGNPEIIHEFPDTYEDVVARKSVSKSTSGPDPEFSPETIENTKINAQSSYRDTFNDTSSDRYFDSGGDDDSLYYANTNNRLPNIHFDESRKLEPKESESIEPDSSEEGDDFYGVIPGDFGMEVLGENEKEIEKLLSNLPHHISNE